MRFLPLIPSVVLFGLVNACGLINPAQAKPSPTLSVANLPDATYMACSKGGSEECSYHFEFRKTGSRIVGYFIMADDDICVEGKVNGNTITGFGLERSSRTYTKPQAANPRFKNSTLQEWMPGISSFKVANQRVINRPISTSNGKLYSVYWRYNSASLNLNDYLIIRPTSPKANLDNHCQIN